MPASQRVGHGRVGPPVVVVVAVVVAAAVAAVWLGVAARSGQTVPAPAGAGSAARHPPAPGTISTVAGGPGGPGPAPRIALAPCGLSYSGGALYVAGQTVVRRISTRTGWLTNVAGDGIGGGRGGGGPAGAAQLQFGGPPYGPCASGVARDAAGNLLIADSSLGVVPASGGTFYGQPMRGGHIYWLKLHLPYGPTDVTTDHAGNVLMISTDYSSCRECSDTPGVVRVLAVRSGTFYGMPMRAGQLYTIAGDPAARQPGNGGPATKAALGQLAQVTLDAAGNVLVADMGRTGPGGRGGTLPEIRVVAARDGTFYGQWMTAGHIYDVAGGGHGTPSGGPATSASMEPQGVATDPAGNVVVGDGDELQVVAVRDGTFYGQPMRAGHIYRVAGTARRTSAPSGDGGPASTARIDASYVAVDGAGNLAFCDGATVRVVAVRDGTFYGRPMRAGHIYRVAGTGGRIEMGGPARRSVLPGSPAGVAADRSGLVIGFGGTGPAFAPAASGKYFGAAMTAGHLYRIPVAGGRFGAGAGAVAADRAGNVLIADQSRKRVLVAPVRAGRFYGQRMRPGHLYAVAGDGRTATSGLGGPALRAGLFPQRVVADRRGDLFITDNPGAYNVPGRRILMVPAATGTYFGARMRGGHIYAVAGDGGFRLRNGVPATRSGMSPNAAAVDAAGNLVVVDDYRVRVVAARTGTFYGIPMRTGAIYTIAGPFTGAHDVAVGPHGNILVLDAAEHIVRLVAVRSGTFYGQRATAGHTYVVAGRHRGPASLGDGGPATLAWLDSPDAIAVAPDGRLLIAMSSGGRIQSVSP